MKSLPTVEEMALMSPMCSMIVARAIGTIAMIALQICAPFEKSTPRIVCALWTGKPIQSALATAAKSTLPRQHAST